MPSEILLCFTPFTTKYNWGFSVFPQSLHSFQTTASSMSKILFKQHKLSGSGNSSICFFQHVSSWGGKGGWEQAVGGKKNSRRAERAFTEFRFCVLTADAAEWTHKLMREGKKFPISTTKMLGVFLNVPLSSQPNDELLIITSSLHIQCKMGLWKNICFYPHQVQTLTYCGLYKQVWCRFQ